MRQWGNDDANIDFSLCAWVAGAEDVVMGVIGEGSTKEIVCNWESPFEDSSIGSMFKKVGGAVQKTTGMTSLSTLASTQTWTGNEPYLFDLVLKLYALHDPWTEVEGAILALEKMAAPNVNELMPGGRVPAPVDVHIGQHQIVQKCYIKSISIPMDKERSHGFMGGDGGYMMRADVNLQVGTILMVNRPDLDSIYK
jgi:hypothetical protein